MNLQPSQAYKGFKEHETEKSRGKEKVNPKLSEQ